MGAITKISWCDHSASPWHGCQHAVDPDGAEHPACKFCYAEAMAKRNPGTLGTWGPDGTRVVSKSFAANCRRWNREAEAAGVRQSVFPSICDPFEDWRGPMIANAGGPVILNKQGRASNGRDRMTMDDARRDLFATIDACHWLDFLLLTKRPANVRRMWQWGGGDATDYDRQTDKSEWRIDRPNVFLGTSISDQHTADMWVPRLLECRDLCPVLFVSDEPMLGHVDLHAYLPRLDQVIIGCESRGTRVGRLNGALSPAEPHSEEIWWNWAGQIVAQCRMAGVAAFVKQGPRNGKVCHDVAQFPEECRVREFPEVHAHV